MTLGERAIAIAEQAHMNQKRRNGEPYIMHPRRVADKLTGDTQEARGRIKAIALLHDVLEDTPITVEYLRKAKIPEDVIQAVAWLTRTKSASSGAPKENYFEYIMGLIGFGNKDVLLVKLADLADNLSDLEEGSMKDKYRFAQYILSEEMNRKYPMWISPEM